MEARTPVKSTKKTFRIIETLRELDGAGVTELARELDLHKSSVHNYLMTLMEEEYVVREGDEYIVGTQFLELGMYARNRREVYRNGREEVDDLAARTGEWASLLVEEQGRGTYLHVAGGEQAVPGNKEIVGTRVHLHGMGLGKAILAHMPEDRVREVVDRHGLPTLTDNTITDLEELREHLEEIRIAGFARDDEESTRGFRCVAAPIVVRGDVLGAVSVTGPTRRLQGDTWNSELPDQVLETANVIEMSIEFS